VAEISRVHIYPLESILSLLQTLDTAGEQKKTLIVRVTVKRNRDTREDAALIT
jgi:hypothetical protein